LQDAVREQAERIAGLSVENSDLAQQVAGLRETVAALQARLSAEQAARQKIEAQRDAELAAHRTERSALEAEAQTLSARVTATDRILSHARAQLLEKDEALRTAERTIKEAVLERGKIERQLATAQEDFSRLSAQLDELNTSRTELYQRCDVLTRTVAAKQAEIDSANGKVASLSGRMEQLTRRFEQERAALELSNRRLIEELQNEKAERSLAQGALEIARESRFRLQKQYAALKQRSRLGADNVAHYEAVSDSGRKDASPEPEMGSNIRQFPPGEEGETRG
jgi:crescentin